MELTTAPAVAVPINRIPHVKKITLLPSEAKMLQAIADGLSNEEIAERMKITLRDVFRIRASVYRKAGIQNAALAVHLAMYLGLTTGIKFPHITVK